MFDRIDASIAASAQLREPAGRGAADRTAAFSSPQRPHADAPLSAKSGAAQFRQQRLLDQFETLRPALPDRPADVATSRAALLDQPLPDAGRDYRRQPLTVREFNALRAQRAAGLEVPDYPPPRADLGATDYSDPEARADVLAGLAQLGWHGLGEDDIDWERMQVSANARRRLAEDHLGRTVLQIQTHRGWQNAGDLRTYDGLGGIYKPALQGDSGGAAAVFGPHANRAQIDEILANNWLPSFFDGSEFHAHERPRYRDDGTLISGGVHGDYRPTLYRSADIPIVV